jgi:hypothetical protein
LRFRLTWFASCDSQIGSGAFHVIVTRAASVSLEIFGLASFGGEILR